MKIAFAGDVFLGGDLLEGSRAAPLQCPAWSAADKRILNLEHPISDRERRKGDGMLHAPSRALWALKAMNVDAVGTANNHFMDRGADGLAETLGHLGGLGISAFGAGLNLAEARRPHGLGDGFVVLAYGDFDKEHYPFKAVADAATAGFAPLRLAAIKQDLDRLGPNERAILLVHWGRPEVWLPPEADIDLARALLEDDRVALVVGCHAHRAQGLVRHNGKSAFMCLGNFLVPNMYLDPGYRITSRPDDVAGVPVTRVFRKVERTTYLKWRRDNRVSLIVTFDTKSGKATFRPVLQNDDHPRVRQLTGLTRALVHARILLLSAVYALPAPLYRLVRRLTGTPS